MVLFLGNGVIMNNDESNLVTEDLNNNEYDLVDNEILKYYSLVTDKKRIVLVGHSGDNGGAEILLKNMIQEFIKQDIEVSVLMKFDGSIKEEYKKFAPTFVIDTVDKIEYYIRELRKYGYQSAILNTTLCGNLIPIFHNNGFYVISLVHELPGVIRLLHAEEYVDFIAENSDLTIFPSSFVCEKFENMCKIKNQKLIQPQGFYNVYDDFDNDRSHRKIVEKHNIPSENNIILNVGSGELRKGFDLFLEVAKKFKTENYSFIWVGSINDEMERKYMEEFADEKNIILTGFISDKDEIMSYYDACDVFMLTSREDPFPSVVLEAFNAKKPVIGFQDAGGFKDIVINNETGFLVEYGSVTSLVKKIKLICNDDELKERLGNNAKLLCQKYNFHEYIHILKIYSIVGVRILNLESDVNSQREKILYLENDLNSKNNKVFNLENMNKKLTEENKEISKLKKQNKNLLKQKNEILGSSSWKITKPIRAIKRNVKKVFKLKNKVTFKIDSSNEKTVKKYPKKSVSKKSNKKLIKNYSFIKTYPYSYKTYLTNENVKRVNLFFDVIDEDIYRLDSLFKFILEYCKKYDYKLRIIYNNANFKAFNFFLNAHRFSLPDDVAFLNLKDDNYIEVGLNEKYVCSSWKNAKSLINSSCINSIIYYYLDDLSEFNDSEYYNISNVCYSDNVVILNDDSEKLKQFKNFAYDYDIEIYKKVNGKNKILYCDFGEMISEGIELLNYLFLNNILDVKQWSINIISKENISNFYSDSKKLINVVSEKSDDCDLFLKFNFNEEKIEFKNDNVISISAKKVYDKSYDVINISNIDEIDSFNKFVWSKTRESKFLPIGEIINNFNEVN